MGDVKFLPPLKAEGRRTRVSVTGYGSNRGLVDAMIKAEEQAEDAGFSISWILTVGSAEDAHAEAHGIARRVSRGR